MGLVNLVYVSAAKHNMTDAELKAILDVSRENNKERNITGMLLYRNGYFIQALEGEEDDIDAIYGRIADDERHDHVLLISKEPISERSFGDWSMGFTNLNQVDPAELEGYNDFLERPFDPEFASENAGKAKRLLNSFKNRTYF